MSNLLPQSFSELEPYCDKWLAETEKARNQIRTTSTLKENVEFYDAVMPRFEEMLKHLDNFPVSDLPAAEENLLKLIYGFVEASCPAERFHSPVVTDTFPPERFTIHEDSPASGW